MPMDSRICHQASANQIRPFPILDSRGSQVAKAGTLMCPQWIHETCLGGRKDMYRFKNGRREHLRWHQWTLLVAMVISFLGCHDISTKGGDGASPSRRCISGDLGCGKERCAVDEYVMEHRCVPCQPGTHRPSGDSPLGSNTNCQGPPIDLCPDDVAKTDPGVCGCGYADLDRNGDGSPDCDSNLCGPDEHVVSLRCQPCGSGLNRPGGDDPSTDDTQCFDVDECEIEADACHGNAECINVIGGYRCECLPGYMGDGHHCKPELTGERGEPIASPPDFSGLPFSDRIPTFPRYRIPGPDDCHWTIESGTAISAHGLADIEDDYPVGAAYRASIEAGHQLPITFCVIDNAGSVIFGGGWSRYGNRSVFVEDGDDFLPMEAEFVGLSDIAEIHVSWDTRWGKVNYLGLFNIGLRGPNDSFIIRANSGIGRLIMDGCWWLASSDYSPGREHEGHRHASGMHIDKWDLLIWRRHRWRGKTPNAPGVNLREHSAYLKSSRGQTWILENDLRGGNRTGFQIRPEPGHNERPVGPVIIAYNRAHGYGWNNGDTPETFDGGSALTVWTNPDHKTFIFRNQITDAKYGCLMVGAQPEGLNWFNDAGFPIGEVHVAENHFENERGDRGAVGLTAVEDLHLYENEIHGDLTLNSQWGMRRHGIGNGTVSFYDESLVNREIYTYDRQLDRTRLMSDDEKRVLLSVD